MIPRFSRPEMAAIWEPWNKFNTWLNIELLVCEAQVEIGLVPVGVPAKIRRVASFDVERIEEIEQDVKHDFIAFLTAVSESVGEDARYLHLGLTSSDVIDTGFSLQLRQAGELVLQGIDRLQGALKRQVMEHAKTMCIGRSHGIHAEPTTFGLKMAGHYAAFARAKQRLKNAIDEINVCAISGAVGTFATVDPRVEEYVAKNMNMQREPVSTQVVPRDRHAMFFATLGVIAASLENLATEIRHLQRTEVGEAEEYFSPGQKGSSAMPHKRNPVLCENITGVARLIRSAVVPAFENVSLWHERDISHSSVERIIAPDATLLADFALHRMAEIVEKLVVHPARMKENMERTQGLIFSQSVLLALTNAGLSRDDAYKIVQTHAMAVHEGKGSFRGLLEHDPAVQKKLDKAALDQIFEYEHYIKHVDAVIKRALKE